MEIRATIKQKPAVLEQSSPAVSYEDGATLKPILAFSVIGLLFAVTLTLMPPIAKLAPTELLLALMAAPVAAWLGFTLGRPD